VEPVVWEIAALSTPDEHEMLTVPPPLEVATARSYEGESSVKLPPVELERVARMLDVAACSASATEPVAMVSVVVGERREVFSAVAKLSGAA
jgi:hypothetical protein